MSWADTKRAKVRAAIEAMPGKRGADVPEKTWDRIHEAASATTLPIWGRHPEPAHYQYLYDNGLHQPDDIKRFYEAMPHPVVSDVTVGDFPKWQAAYEAHRDHS